MFSTSILSLSLGILAAVPSTLAHGYIKSVTIDGQFYQGLKPNQKGESIVRNIASSFPINDVNDLSTNCGIDAKAAALTADAKPGSELVFDWAGGDDGKWPHDTGPIIDYIASCNGDCADFDSQLANWVKIEQVGRKAKGQPWVQRELFEGKPYTMRLPDSLPNGNYLVRHEVIGLHIATQLKGVEMYPSCTQIKVTGGKSGSLPAGGVKFPGAYKQDDPGLLITNQFDSNADYPFPGPKLAKFSGSGGGDPAPTTTEEDPASTDGPSATSDGSAPTTTVKTTKKQRPTSSASSIEGDPTNTAEPALVTVTEYVTVTSDPLTEETPTPTSTVTEVQTITVTGQAAAATTDYYGGLEDHYRIKRSRIFGKRSSRGH